MNLPILLPDWVPWWVPLALLVPCLLYALAFLFMPFSVIGMKGRLEALDARLDEIQGEIRSLSLRIPERGATRSHFDELYTAPSPSEPSLPEFGLCASAHPAGVPLCGGAAPARAAGRRHACDPHP